MMGIVKLYDPREVTVREMTAKEYTSSEGSLEWLMYLLGSRETDFYAYDFSAGLTKTDQFSYFMHARILERLLYRGDLWKR